MDQETIRLLVAAIGAVIAGLGGAFIAGDFNRRNTKASIKAAAEQAEAARRHDEVLEHAQWLRDRKVAAYQSFISQVREIDQLVGELYAGVNIKGTFDLVLAARKVNTLDIRLLAPEDVWRAAIEAMKATQQLAQVFIDKQESDQSRVDFDAASNVVAEKLEALERLVSHDLRVPGES
ncbi:hypothetical protein [Arthrobacter sp. MDT1-65]